MRRAWRPCSRSRPPPPYCLLPPTGTATSELSGFGPHGLGRLLVHLDLLCRLDTEITARHRCRAEEHGLDGLRSVHCCAGYDFLGRTVTAERVDGNADGVHALGGRRAKRLDLGAHGTSCTWGTCGETPWADRRQADREARRLDLVLRATLVAPRLRRLSLRDSHERLPSLARSRPLPPVRSRVSRLSAKSVTITPKSAMAATTQNGASSRP